MIELFFLLLVATIALHFVNGVAITPSIALPRTFRELMFIFSHLLFTGAKYICSVLYGVFIAVSQPITIIVRNIAMVAFAERAIRRTEKSDDQRPPKFAEYLLYFLPKKEREPLLGDLEEEYREVYKKFGKGKAKFWYYCQVAMSFWPYIARAVKKLVGLGVVGWAGSVIRRWIG